MRIGFYGDSFCENNSEGPIFGLIKNFPSWMDIVAENYNAKIVHTGQGGSSHWDCIINQFLPVKNLPDICIFCWTDKSRLFHKTVRCLRYNEALEYDKSFKFVPTYTFGLNKDVWKAANAYYKYLYDDTKASIEYDASLMWFDNFLSTKDKIIIHLWSFSPSKSFTFKTGVDTRIGIADKFETTNIAPNHMPNKEDHITLANLIINAIDNYKVKTDETSN
jgi:hypothetical protein